MRSWLSVHLSLPVCLGLSTHIDTISNNPHFKIELKSTRNRLGGSLPKFYQCAALSVLQLVKVRIIRKCFKFKMIFSDATNRIHFFTMTCTTKIWKNKKRKFFWSISIMQILDSGDMISVFLFIHTWETRLKGLKECLKFVLDLTRKKISTPR